MRSVLSGRSDYLLRARHLLSTPDDPGVDLRFRQGGASCSRRSVKTCARGTKSGGEEHQAPGVGCRTFPYRDVGRPRCPLLRRPASVLAMSPTRGPRRLAALLCGASFALLSLTLSVTRPCTMHGAVAHEASAPVQRGHGAHHVAGSSAQSSAPSDAPVEAPLPAHSCDCAALCCCVPGASLHVASARAPAEAAVSSARAAMSAAVALPTPHDHVLPFAVGPPARASG